MEDNKTSADPLSLIQQTIPGRPGNKLSETCKNPLHSFLWSPESQTLNRPTIHKIILQIQLRMYNTKQQEHLSAGASYQTSQSDV